MTDLEKAAQQALEALSDFDYDKRMEAIAAMRRALEQPAYRAVKTFHEGKPVYVAEQPAQQQEPVAWRDHVEQRLLTWRQSFVNKSGDQLALEDFMDKRSLDDLIDFVCDEYTRPQAREPLTDEEIMDMYNEPRSDAEMLEFARAIEAAHGIKGDA